MEKARKSTIQRSNERTQRFKALVVFLGGLGLGIGGAALADTEYGLGVSLIVLGVIMALGALLIWPSSD